MSLKPCGVKILIEVLPVEIKSAGGIVMHSENEVKREKVGRDVGTVKAIGFGAYYGIGGCSKDKPAIERAKEWGFTIGDTVEFNRYDGKPTRFGETNKEFENYRLIDDQDIIGVLKDEH